MNEKGFSSADFRVYVLKILIPKLKKCVKNLKKAKRKKELIYESGVKVLALLYENCPRFLMQLDLSLGVDIKQNLTAEELDFFLECHDRFKKRPHYLELNKGDEHDDYGGQCFDAAYGYMLRHQHDPHDLRLVHGWVYNPSIDKYMAHAWVEENAEYVHDLTQKKGLRKLLFSSFYEMAITCDWAIRKYSIKEMSAYAEETGVYGPWDKVLFYQEFLTVAAFEEWTDSYSAIGSGTSK
ncbi:MAG: hypothetical protein HQK50_15455 [Oligoflexia bacterium]|nr:hypothetical protein [Oligoflexia bacterium]MBF0366971.1 hypothetical protein [Oligoflexia bacterium]